ncbi:MAG: transglutaminase domain-containing protein [Polyangiaceae bacterium]|nr:transglutaminase domain-containing protein [Polyangiaceae bacterium]
MIDRMLRVLPFALVVVLLAFGGAPWFWCVPLGLAGLGALVVPPRREVSTFAELVLVLGIAFVPVAWVRASDEDWGLALPLALIVMAMAAARLYLDRGLLGPTADATLLLTVAVIAGIGLKSPAYPYLVGALALVLLVSRSGVRRTILALRRTSKTALVVLLLLGASAAAMGLYALPVLNDLTNRRMGRLFMGMRRSTGFSPYVRLDGEGSIRESDDVVLRLTGAQADYLRGAVFDSFDGTYWTSSRRPSAVAPAESEPQGPDATHVLSMDLTAWVLTPMGSRVFVPASSSTDPYGVHRVEGSKLTRTWSFVPGDAAPAPPSAIDLVVPAYLVPDLRAIALEWTAGASTDEERLQRIEARFAREFRYTLTRKPSRSRSVLLEFLRENREGHCEFFASAMVVLARSLGIPARLVAGYRVVESNGFGDYRVVRSKHAHAWVEAYVEHGGAMGFRTFDPTPPNSVLAAPDARSASAFFDYLRVALSQAYRDAVERPERIVGVLLVLIVVGFAVRAILRRRRARLHPEGAVDLPPEMFLRFERALAARGLSRGAAETLEAFADRVGKVDADAADVLRRYAERRYGPGETWEAMAAEMAAEE